MPIYAGSTPADTVFSTRAMGFSPSSLAFSSDMITMAAAPSFTPEALPAVTVPFSFLNTGRSFCSASSV